MASTYKSLSAAQLQALITGIPTYCATTVFSVAGQTFTAPEAVNLLTTVLNASTAVTAARASWKASLQAEEKSLAAQGSLARELRDSIALMFSNATTTLSALAISPKKVPKPLSAAARAAATAKAKATREARGTTSKKQKAQITGDVTGVTITPVTEPGAAPPPPTSEPAVPASPALVGGIESASSSAAVARHA